MTQATAPTPLADELQALPAGMRVAEFEVRRVLGSGGFGIVYLAWDHALEREVALKEYMPGTLAGRGTGLQVSVRSKATADTFALGLRSFINEARLLARFDHPSLVKVYRFWEDNGTAYMVMPRYLGRTLRQARHAMVVPPGDAACRRVLDALLSALEVLHREGVYHRDIAPDNILLGDDGLPVLLDFGAARHVLGDQTQALTSIMKPHYAPLEQYADSSAMRQGPWTDLYALGGTMYYLITGEVPMAAASRALHDDQPRLAVQGARGCSHGLLAAIDWMLALRPPERPQSVHMLRDVLEGRITMPGRSTADKTAPGVAARHAATAPPPPRTDIDIDDDLSGGVHARSDGSSAAGHACEAPAAEGPHEATVMQAQAGAAEGTTPPPVTPTSPPTQPALSDQPTTPPATAPFDAQATASAAPLTQPPRVRRASATAARVLGALVVLNLLAWWWFTQPAAPPPAASMRAEVSPQAAQAAAAKSATSPTPVQSSAALQAAPAADAAASETVLSILPARVANPRAASPNTAQPGGAATAAAAPDTSAGSKSLEPQALPARARSNVEAAARTLPSAAPAAAAALSGPRERCGERNFLSMLICVKRECEQPALRGHPECVKMRQQEESQRERNQ